MSYVSRKIQFVSGSKIIWSGSTIILCILVNTKYEPKKPKKKIVITTVAYIFTFQNLGSRFHSRYGDGGRERVYCILQWVQTC